MTIPPNPHPEQVEITQEDREAAANLVVPHGRWPGFPTDFRSGRADANELTQAFARHRLASLANRPADDGAAAPIKESATMTDYPARIFLEPVCGQLDPSERRWSEDPFEVCGKADCPHCGPNSDPGEYALIPARAPRNDDAAKALYNSWSDQPGWVPWVDGGNSTMQDEARLLVHPQPEGVNLP